ncbi:DUF1704 domain-containing protein [Candidatus Saccharibacteria bacterium]|nr:MAG: DUF1704 domain-containing protein [Candidatus Saccharibacteria bacterium]
MHETQQSSQRLALLKPNIIAAVVPSNMTEQKQAFMLGKVRNPRHNYSKLDRNYRKGLRAIVAVGERAISSLGVRRPRLEAMYEDTIEDYVETNELMYFMDQYRRTTDPAARLFYRQEIVRLNAELYGTPKLADYHHVLAHYTADIPVGRLRGKGAAVYAELAGSFSLLESVERAPSYAPDPKTLAWMGRVVTELYGGMLAHVEDNRQYAPVELQQLFRTVIHEEFGGEIAEEWRVDLEPAAAITVDTVNRRIIIPIDRQPVSSEKAKDLVVHEIGVHMLRSVNGYETDIPLLATGLSRYADSEEGLAVIIEQARKGKFVEMGHASYLAASLAYFEGKDFRGTFEVMWRVLALKRMGDGPDLTEEMIVKAKNTAYALCMRTFRGTDDIPWFKDLQYYNGAIAVWKHLDAICGDTDKFQLMMMGKTRIDDPAQDRIVLEAGSN